MVVVRIHGKHIVSSCIIEQVRLLCGCVFVWMLTSPGTSATKLHAVLLVTLFAHDGNGQISFFCTVIPTSNNCQTNMLCHIYCFSSEGFAAQSSLLGLVVLQGRRGEAVSSLQVAGGSGPVGAASIGGWQVSGHELWLGGSGKAQNMASWVKQ